MTRCDFCRSPCGWSAFPAIILSSTCVTYIPCTQDGDLIADPLADWVSSDTEQEFNSDGEEIQTDPNEDCQPKPEFEPEPKPKRRRTG